VCTRLPSEIKAEIHAHKANLYFVLLAIVTFGSNDQSTMFLMSTQVLNQVQKFPKIKDEVSARPAKIILIKETVP
jgi:hypothetical protein